MPDFTPRRRHSRQLQQQWQQTESSCDIMLGLFIGGGLAKVDGEGQLLTDYNRGPPLSEQVTGERGFSHAAAAEVAFRQINAECDHAPRVVNSVKVFDTYRLYFHAMEFGVDQECNARTLCAYVLPVESYHTVAFSFLGEAMRVPVIPSGGSFNPAASAKRYFRHTVKNEIHTNDHTDALVEYLQRHLSTKRDFLAVLTDPRDRSPSGDFKFYQQSANKYGMTLQQELLTMQDPTSEKEVETALRRIRQRGFHTILLNLFDTLLDLPVIATVADRLGLLGEDYFWIFSYYSMPLHFPKAWRKDLPESVHRLMDGAAVVHLLDGFLWRDRKLITKNGDVKHYPKQDPFLAAWRQQNGSFVDTMNTKMRQVRLRPPEPKPYEAPQDYFQTEDPFHYASFVYDSIIAVGRAACRSGYGKNATLRIIPEIVQAPPYDGASGRIQWTSDMKRNAEDVAFGIYNIRRRTIDSSTPQSDENSTGCAERGRNHYAPIVSSLT